MKRFIIMLMLLFLAVPVIAAEPLRVYVGEFNAVGAKAKEDTKAMLQALLASRLGNDKILSVSTPAEAEVIINGTYVVIGKHYNLDAVCKTASSQTITRTSVQGEGGEETLFAVTGELAGKLSAELLKKVEAGSIPRIQKTVIAAVPVVAPKPVNNEIIRNSAANQSPDLKKVEQGDIVRPQSFYRGVPNRGEIKRLDGMYNLMAVGPVDETGKRMLFMAQNQSVALLREGEERPIAGFTLAPNQKIFGLDYIDSDGNGTPELFVTVLTGGDIDSQVWELKNKRLVKVADKIPYFFRAIALAGGTTRLYAQEQGRGLEQYYGDVYEVARKGAKIIRKNKIAMPRYGNVYSFNQFKNIKDELLTVVYHSENYLIVYDKEQKELWRSNDAFGGSELYYQVEDTNRIQGLGDQYMWFFKNQPIQVTSKQEILVGKNDGFWVLGNARMYKKGAVYSLYWNGAALEESWRTKDTQNYMPDFYFDEGKSELLLLQLTNREDILMRNKGATALQIKKVE